MKLTTLKPRIPTLPDRIKTLRTPRVRPTHASQDEAAQASQADDEARPGEMPGPDPIPQVRCVAQAAKAGTQ